MQILREESTNWRHNYVEEEEFDMDDLGAVLNLDDVQMDQDALDMELLDQSELPMLFNLDDVDFN